MRVIILTWEYPPRIIGRLAEYVNALSVQLVKSKVETHVVTYHDFMTGAIKEVDGVNVVRVSNPVRTHISVLTWVLTLNQEIERAASNVFYQSAKQVDLVDVFDWHFIPAAVTLKNALGIPFVYSVESLEEHRSPDANTQFNMAIRGIEWLGLYEAKKIAAKSNWMKNEITRIYQVPEEKISIVSPESGSWVREVLDIYKSEHQEASNIQ
jgi:hypothetical protein